MSNVDDRPSLATPIAKLERAERLKDDLLSAIEERFPLGRPWPVIGEVSEDGLLWTFRVGTTPEIDPEWILVIGDVLFDLRCALDHLVYQLHRHELGDPLPEKAEKSSAFPICDSRKDWTGHKRRIAQLADSDKTRIEWFQPFQRQLGDDEHHPVTWTRYWLGKLNSLHNLDKHRRLHVVAAAQNGTLSVPEQRPQFDGEARPKWGPLGDDRIIETWSLRRPIQNDWHHPGALIYPTIEWDEWVQPDVLLRACCTHVRLVLESFAERLGG